MSKSNLTNNEIIVLRLLLSGQLRSAEIPEAFFSLAEKESLVDLGLIELSNDSDYVITEKAVDALVNDQYIIKYPLSTEEGVVMNYKEVLESCTQKAAQALGLTIINTQFYKKWGKYNNLTLLKELEETKIYYRNFVHPIAKIKEARNDINVAEARYQKTIKEEFEKIYHFKLPTPLSLGITNEGIDIVLTEVIDKNTAAFDLGQGPLIIENYDESIDFFLSANTKHQIIEQYYSLKSKSTTVTKNNPDTE